MRGNGLARRGRLILPPGDRDRRDKSMLRPGPTAAGVADGSRTALGAGTLGEDAPESSSDEYEYSDGDERCISFWRLISLSLIHI